MFKEKVKTPPESPPITVINPDDQSMWSSTRTVAPTLSSAIIQPPIHNFRIKDDPTQGVFNTGRIFLYKTPNKAFKILEDKVILKLDFRKSSQNLKTKTDVSTGRSNVNPDHEILTEKLEALTRKINFEFLIIRKELKEMRDGHRDNHDSELYMRDDTLMCDPMEANYGDVDFMEDAIKPIPTMPNLNPIISNSPTVSPFPKDCTVHISYKKEKKFEHDVLLNHVGGEEFNKYDGVGIGGLKEKEIKKDENAGDGERCLEAKSINLTCLC
nr:hypothetical protein [Tanacetum cinerariifolium]